MSEKDVFGDLAKAHETEFIKRREREQMETLRRSLAESQKKKELGEAVGVADEKVLSALAALGFDRDTALLIHLVPPIRVAWSDEIVTKEERRKILEIATLRGVADGSSAHALLTSWLDRKPTEEFFDRVFDVVRLYLEVVSPETKGAVAHDLEAWSQQVAQASRGFFGLGAKVADDEKRALAEIARMVSGRPI